MMKKLLIFLIFICFFWIKAIGTVADFSAQNFCVGEFTILKNTSTITGSQISANWAFDNDSLFDDDSGDSVSHQFLFPGSYTIGLQIITTVDTDTVFKSVTIYDTPLASASLLGNDSVQCLLVNNFGFINTSSISSMTTLSYLWEFGDGNTDTSSSDTIYYNYSTIGTYQVKLTVTSVDTCISTTQMTVRVTGSPTAGFTINNNIQCQAGNSFVFTNTSIDGKAYQWDFGDGNQSTIVNPTHNYSTVDTFQVKLVTLNAAGCKDSITQIVYTISTTLVGFQSTNHCIGQTTIFKDTSFSCNTVVGYNWALDNDSLFDDGTIDSVGHIYTTAGTYSVGLVVISTLGSDTLFKSITISNAPNANFTIDDTAQCFYSNDFIFRNTSSITSGTMSYFWDFGDTSTSITSSDSFNYSYYFDSTFIVVLTASNPEGCKDTYNMLTYVYPEPVASFTVSDTVNCPGDSFIFTNTSTISSGTLSYHWYFGDGNDSTNTHPTYGYQIMDTFSTKLVVTSNNNCIDSTSKYLYNDSTSRIGFVSTEVCLGDSTLLTSTSTSCNTILSYYWDFDNDGKFDDSTTGSQVYHTFSTSGNHIVGLKLITDKDTTTITNSVTINPLPTVLFVIVSDTSQSLSTNNFIFTNTSTSASYLWSFGDGATAQDTNTSHIYSTSGTFSIKLIGTTSKGCKDSISKNVYVKSALSADFTINDTSQCMNNNNFIFTDISTFTDTIRSYDWDLDNDGIFTDASGSTLNHTFSNSGTFPVGLQVRTDYDTNFIYKQVTILPIPTADFYTTSACSGLSTNFNDSSTFTGGTIIKYYWDFENDGNINDSSGPSVSHTYSGSGPFNAKLEVLGDNGCYDNIVKSVTMGQNPTAGFTVQLACVGDSTHFTSTSSAGVDTIENYIWDFGDGDIAILLKNPTHYYDTAGTYIVTLEVYTQNGCKDTTTKTVTIISQPKMTLSYSGDTIFFVGSNVTITVNESFDSIVWSTGTQGSSFTTDTSGTYTVTAFDTNGCSVKRSTQVVVNTKAEKLSATNLFTPNGDGVNDYWIIKDIDAFKPLRVNIYNNFGDEVYSSTNYPNDWDGTYEGDKLPEGTYYYIAKTKNDVVYKGAINILR